MGDAALTLTQAHLSWTQIAYLSFLFFFYENDVALINEVDKRGRSTCLDSCRKRLKSMNHETYPDYIRVKNKN